MGRKADWKEDVGDWGRKWTEKLDAEDVGLEGRWCNRSFDTGQRKNYSQNSENVYQCPLQLCLQLFQLCGDSGWILLAFFLEGNKVEEGIDSTRILFSSGGQAVCHEMFQTQGIFGKGTLCPVKLSLPWYWHNKVDPQTWTLSWTVCLEHFWALLLRLFSHMDITLRRLLPVLTCQEKICEKKKKRARSPPALQFSVPSLP